MCELYNVQIVHSYMYKLYPNRGHRTLGSWFPQWVQTEPLSVTAVKLATANVRGDQPTHQPPICPDQFHQSTALRLVGFTNELALKPKSYSVPGQLKGRVSQKNILLLVPFTINF